MNNKWNFTKKPPLKFHMSELMLQDNNSKKVKVKYKKFLSINIIINLQGNFWNVWRKIQKISVHTKMQTEHIKKEIDDKEAKITTWI